MHRTLVCLIAVALFVALASGLRGGVYAQPYVVPSGPPTPTWTPDVRSNVDSLVGWPSGDRVRTERKWEDQFVAYPSADNALDIERHLSSVLHRAGSAADYQTAVYFRDRLESDGFIARFETFEVAFTGPIDQRLELVTPQAKALDLLEGQPGNHTEWEKIAGPAFFQDSGDGDLTAPVFYINGGSDEDWKAFDEMHVTMPAGSIVIAHFVGGPSRDPRAAARQWDQLVKHKVGGVIVYYDPRNDGFVKGEVWPKGPYKNEYMAERTGGPRPGIASLRPPGDPTLPGEAPLPGKKHLDWQTAVPVPFPEMLVTQSVARQLLASLDGPVVPETWHDGFELVEHVGGGGATAHMAVKMERKLVTIWNVIGTLRGTTKPNEIVVIGSHRDAMTFGAIDPGSGSTVMLQVADSFKKLLDAGWRPDRTIQIKSWDGHELGLWGSISEAYKDGPTLRKHVVQYINTDQLTNGPPFRAAMSPELWAFGRELASYVKGIDGKPIVAGENTKDPVFRAPGGGSDHMTFIYWLGVPGSSAGYYGHFGAHHTAEDNIDGIKTYDPGFLQAVAMARFTGVQAMRAAGAERMPLRLTEESSLLLSDIEALKRTPQYAEVAKSVPQFGAELSHFQDHLRTYHDAALVFDAKLQAAERSGNVAQLDALEAKAAEARDVFWMPEGLSYNKYWHTIDRYTVAFPELNFAMYESENLESKVKAALERLTSAVDRAISLVS
jgi:N-acetylated-alpha-linked acidic dipeptidase